VNLRKVKDGLIVEGSGHVKGYTSLNEPGEQKTSMFSGGCELDAGRYRSIAH